MGNQNVNEATLYGPLYGRVALVTGSSSGHGREIAIELARRGARVMCTDVAMTSSSAHRRPGEALPTHESIADFGGQALFCPVDVRSLAQLTAAVGMAVQKWGRLDIMVNNAGIGGDLRSIVDDNEETFDRVMSVNAKGCWAGAKAAITQMYKQEPIEGRRGRVINLASISGHVGEANDSAYSASKGAVLSLTRALAIECAPRSITVNAVSPGYIRTAMTDVYFDDSNALKAIDALHPLGCDGTPHDVATAVAFFASDDARWITGVALPVDGGFITV